MPVDLSSLLAETLSNDGYEVEDSSPIEGASGASYPVSLVARKKGQRYLVDALASRTIRDEDVQAVASIVDDTGLDGALVLALAGSQASRSGPGSNLVDIWDRSKVNQMLGGHLLDKVIAGDVDPDQIGPSPVEPYELAERRDSPSGSSNGQDTSTRLDASQSHHAQEAESSGEAPSLDPGSPPSGEPAPDDKPSGEEHPAPSQSAPQQAKDPAPDQMPESAASSTPEGSTVPGQAQDDGQDGLDVETQPADSPEAEPGPEPQPEAPNETTQDEEEQGAPTDLDDVSHRDLVDPEDMLARAEQLMEQGAVDDGDAEILVDEPEPSPEEGSQEPQASADSQAAEQPATDPEPRAPAQAGQPEPEPEPDREATQESSASVTGDAEILEDDTDGANPSGQRPQPDASAPEPEPASTARADDRAGNSPGPSVESPAAAAGPADTTASFVSGATIEPKIDETEAQIKAEEALFEAESSRLELLPFRVYRYKARLEGDGHTREEEGRVWVSTQSGAVVKAPGGDRVDEPEVAHERFEGKLSRAQTKNAARDHLLDTLERRDEVRQDYSESAVIERVRLKPNADALVLESLGKAYAPRWRIEGQNGTVFVDAVTGELVHE